MKRILLPVLKKSNAINSFPLWIFRFYLIIAYLPVVHRFKAGHYSAKGNASEEWDSIQHVYDLWGLLYIFVSQNASVLHYSPVISNLNKKQGNFFLNYSFFIGVLHIRCSKTQECQNRKGYFNEESYMKIEKLQRTQLEQSCQFKTSSACTLRYLL